MIKRLRRATVLCAFFLFTLPTFVQAGLIEWIDHWSGPGPYWGAAFDWRLVCASTDDPTRSVKDPEGGPRNERAAALIGVISPVCVFNPVKSGFRRTASLNLAVAFYKAKENNLPYSDPTIEKDVNLTSLEPSFWVRVGKGLEIGTGFGVMWITGPAFESFQRVYLRPFQVDVKPLLLLKPGAKYGSPFEIISLRAGVLVIPSGFAAKDFGALPGYRAEREFLKTFSLFLDLEPVMRYVSGQR